MSQTPPPPPPQKPIQDPGQNPFAPPAEPPQAAPMPTSTESASALDGIVPTNPLAAISCYMGIFGLITCFGGILFGPIAVVLGFLGLKAWKAKESHYGKAMSSVRAWIGIVTGILATILGLVMVAIAIFSAAGG